MIEANLVPNEQQIFEWIEQVYNHGVRRLGSPADRWAEQHCLEAFKAFGLENVRHEPVAFDNLSRFDERRPFAQPGNKSSDACVIYIVEFASVTFQNQ